MDNTQPKFEQYCIVELYGHNRIAGLVSEQSIGGSTFVRVDVPEVQREASHWVDGRHVAIMETIAAFTKFFGPGAIYAITPTTEEIARAVAKSIATRPITSFDLPQLKELNAPTDEDEDDERLF